MKLRWFVWTCAKGHKNDYSRLSKDGETRLCATKGCHLEARCKEEERYPKSRKTGVAGK